MLTKNPHRGGDRLFSDGTNTSSPSGFRPYDYAIPSTWGWHPTARRQEVHQPWKGSDCCPSGSLIIDTPSPRFEEDPRDRGRCEYQIANVGLVLGVNVVRIDADG